MNALLINMPIRVRTCPNIFPTGVGTLSSLIKNLVHHFEVLDLNANRPPFSTNPIQEK